MRASFVFACTCVAISCTRSLPPEKPRASTAPPAPAPPAAQPAQVERSRLEADVRALAIPREPGSDGWKRVQALASSRLTDASFELERQDYGSGVNLIATAPGRSKERVLVSAHYDHLAECAGADDNASGVAAILELARVLGSHPRERTLVLALWDEEERGLIGSRAYADRARARSEPLSLAISLDGIGFASSKPNSQSLPPGIEQLLPEQAAWLAARDHRADFVALVAGTSAANAAGLFAEHATAQGLPLVRIDISPMQALLAPDVFRSDHASFWFYGFPALLVSDTAEFRNPGYHCGLRADAPETLDYSFLSSVTAVVASASAELLGTPSTRRTGSNEQR